MAADFISKRCLAIIRGIAVWALTFLACSCETVVPYPVTGEEMMLYVSGVAEDKKTTISVRKIFQITDKNFVIRKSATMLDATMLLTVNGNEIETRCSNDSLECLFRADYELIPGDKVTLKVSAPGMRDASCEVTIPDFAEIIGMSYVKVDDNTLNFSASVQTNPGDMDGYVYSLEVETRTMKYVDGALALEKIDTLRYSLHYRDQVKDVSYNGFPVTGYEDADGKGIHSLSTSIGLSQTLEVIEGDGHTVRTERVTRRVRLSALHLSTPLYIGLKTQRNRTDDGSYSDVLFVSPLEYSNISGGKGLFGCVSAYKSEWTEL